MRPRTPLAAALMAALGLTLAGCFSPPPSAPAEQGSSPSEQEPPSEESAPPAISVDPATGVLVTGTGYSVNAPEGWAVPSDAPERADIFISSPDADAAGFIDNVNVLLGPENGQSLAEIEEAGAAYLEAVVGATEVEVRPRVAVAGSETVHFSALLNNSGLTFWTEQYLVMDDGIVYTVTFSFTEAVPREDREALSESVLATWTWA